MLQSMNGIKSGLKPIGNSKICLQSRSEHPLAEQQRPSFPLNSADRKHATKQEWDQVRSKHATSIQGDKLDEKELRSDFVFSIAAAMGSLNECSVHSGCILMKDSNCWNFLTLTVTQSLSDI
uniref:Uncharacterized protein n=1 Tax=Glossina austeni TaxID=7395 RepID=A0A1A9V6B6_GLOAU